MAATSCPQRWGWKHRHKKKPRTTPRDALSAAPAAIPDGPSKIAIRSRPGYRNRASMPAGAKWTSTCGKTSWTPSPRNFRHRNRQTQAKRKRRRAAPTPTSCLKQPPRLCLHRSRLLRLPPQRNRATPLLPADPRLPPATPEMRTHSCGVRISSHSVPPSLRAVLRMGNMCHSQSA